MSVTHKHLGPTEPESTARPANEPHRPGMLSRVPRTRMGTAWVALLAAAFVLLLLLIFILENNQPADVSFFGAHGHLPMGVALLLAAVFGVLLVALPGTVRIIQLRMLGRRRGRDLEHQQIPLVAPDDPAAQQSNQAPGQ
jgi:uncharacterized integral membrane protein